LKERAERAGRRSAANHLSAGPDPAPPHPLGAAGLAHPGPGCDVPQAHWEASRGESRRVAAGPRAACAGVWDFTAV